MVKRILALMAAVLVLSGLGSSMGYSHETKIYFGEKVEIDDYEVEFGKDMGDTSLIFGKWTDTSLEILERLEGIEIYEREGEQLNISENFSAEIVQTGYDDTGRYVKLNLRSKNNIFSSGDLSTSTPNNLMISQGDSADISLNIENTGFVNQSFDLDYETDSEMKVSFSYQDFNVTDVYVPAGEQNSVTAQVEIPERAELGTYDLELSAGNMTEKFSIEVRGREVEKDISLDVDTRFEQVNPGGTVEIPLNVRNGGGVHMVRGSSGPVLENVKFDIGVPEGWEYEIQPEGFSTLDYRDRERAILTVDVPENANEGDFFVETSVSSDETSMDEPEEIRVNVKQRSQMGVIGLLLMAFSFGILVFVYWKFSRR